MRRLILSKEEILKIEKETVEKYGIPNIILMENAGRESFFELKKLIRNFRDKRFLIFCGKGNNGGDGFVLARYLFNHNIKVKVFYFGKPEEFTDISFQNFKILNQLKVDTNPIDNLKLKSIIVEKEKDITIDALLGIGIRGKIEGKMAEIIDFINKNKNFTVSIDIPSGLNADTGEIHGICVKSDITLSMGFLKKGFFIGKGPENCGRIRLLDIGFPKYFYQENEI